MEGSLNSTSDFLQADIDFHLAIGQSGHNTILMNALHLIRNLLQEWIGSTLQIEGIADKALAHHKAIFFPLAKRNGPPGQTAMTSHPEQMARCCVHAAR